MVELGLCAKAGAWYRFIVTDAATAPQGGGTRTIVVLDDQLAVPPGRSLEMRASGLWTELAVQDPYDHFTVDLEAFGVDVGEASSLSAMMSGDRVAVGCELSFDTEVEEERSVERDAMACRVHGDLLIGQDVIAISGFGWRDHSWSVGETPTVMRTRGWRSTTDGPAPFTEALAHSAPVPIDSPAWSAVFEPEPQSAAMQGAAQVDLQVSPLGVGHWTWR